mgnify:FL=1
MAIVSYQIHNGVGVIKLNNPPVNALSQALREGIQQAVTAAQSDQSKVLLIVCEGRTFVAGADITEFGKPPQEPSLPSVLDSIENSAKPVIAAIHGTALGGGFEIALASHYRCAVASAKVGLPEVKLGIIPGAGGTQRTPRIVGVDAALEMITSGTPIAAAKAQALGLIDHIVDGDLLDGAIAYAEALIAENAPCKRVSDMPIDPASATDALFDSWRQKMAKKARGQLAPQKIIDAVQFAVTASVKDGMVRERELFTECVQSTQSSAMRHIFFAERAAAKVKGLAKDTVDRTIGKVGILGGGTMGGGIAMNFANVGIPVVMIEINDEALARGLEIVRKNYAITMSKGKLSEAQMKECLALISGSTHYDDLGDVDLVIEAVFEDLEVKKEVFAKLDKACKDGAILATNTSYQDVDQIAAATRRPGDVIGMHFFSPANVMKLLEVVRGEKTADDVISTTMKLAKTISKIPVLSGVCYGFIGNRMLRCSVRENQLCMMEGASPEQVDEVMQGWGMAMGPLAVGDLAGLDVSYKARQALSDEQKGDPKSYCIVDALVEMGRLGQKSGSGYYRYDPETRARSSDPEVMKVIERLSAEYGIQRRKISNEEILNRITCAWVNEGAYILEEGIAQRSSDIDVVYVNGYGFPVYRGGPMHYADTIGVKKVYEMICEFQQQHGDVWKPSALLTKLAAENKTFSQWSNEQT